MRLKKFDIINSKKIQNFKKTIKVDSDKSLSIRSLLLGSISENISKIDNLLESEDVFSTIKCLKKMGVTIKKKGKIFYVYGKGLGSLFAKKGTKLNFGNSGTLARLLIGILSTTPDIDIKLSGDTSLKKRNMESLIKLMNEFGATFYPKSKRTLPFNLRSSDIPIGINYKAGKSAQLKSAVILAGLNSFGNTNIIEKKKTRNHTELLLKKNSNAIQLRSTEDVNNIKIFGKKTLHSNNMKIFGDPSSAAFFTALTVLKKKSKLTIKNVLLNPTRIGFYFLLKKFGANIIFKKIKMYNNEKIGDIIVKSSNLKPIQAGSKYYFNSTDEYPILFIIAALTKGKSTFKGIEELKNKESDRIKEMQKIIKQIGIRSIYKNGDLVIFGEKKIKTNRVIDVPSLGDHRICMSALILSLITGVKSKIKNFETVRTSFPSFLKLVRYLGSDHEIKSR